MARKKIDTTVLGKSAQLDPLNNSLTFVGEEATAEVFVRNPDGTSGSPATIYVDPESVSVESQPLAADVQARFAGWLETGEVYNVEVTLNGNTWTEALDAPDASGSVGSGTYVNVMDFAGVTGLDAGDQTTGLQAALDAGAGRTVFFPNGTYTSTDLDVPAGTTLLFESRLAILKQIKQGGDPDNQFLLNLDSGSSDVADNIEGVCMQGGRLLGTCDVDAFDAAKQHIHLVRACGVTDLRLEGMLLQGFRGDGLYLQGNDGTPLGDPLTGRHNVNVKVLGCTFDGLVNENRNAISVIDADDCLVDNCTFVNCSHDSMPGPVDYEPNPDSASFAVLRNCRVTNCHFENCEGASGLIALYLWDPTADFGDRLGGFKWTGNTIEDCPEATAFTVHAYLMPGDDDPWVDVQIAHNTVGEVRNSWDVEGNRGVTIAFNTFKDNRYAGFFGYHPGARDVLIAFNDFIRCGFYQGYVIGGYTYDELRILGNRFHDCGVPSTDVNYPYGVIFNMECAVFSVSVDAGTNTITYPTNHGHVASEEVMFSAPSGGTMPGNLTAATIYYVVGGTVTATTMQVSLAPGGAAIDIADAGSGVLGSRPIGRSDHTFFEDNIVTVSGDQTATVDTATDTFTATAHGYSAADKVVLVPDTNNGGLLPAPFVGGTAYFVRDVAADTFKLAATSGGVAIDATSAGASFFVSQRRTTQVTSKSSLHIADSTENRYAGNKIPPGLSSANTPSLDLAAVTGSRSGNAAIADALSELAAQGIVKDSTTAGTTIPEPATADWNEAVQDALTGAMGGSSTADLGYNDASNYFYCDVLDSPLLQGHDWAYVRDRANHLGTQSYASLSGLTRGDLITAGAAGITRVAIGTAGKVLGSDGTDIGWVTASGGVTDHGALTGLADDDHAQYPLLAGRGGEQKLYGGTTTGADLTLVSTFHATKGSVYFGADYGSAYDETLRRLGVGHASPQASLHVKGIASQTDPLMLVEDDTGADRLTLSYAGQLGIPIATGTAPLAVSSTTKVTNLNADLLDDQSGAYYLDRANHTGAGGTAEEAQDAVGTILVDTTTIDFLYDDATPSITAAVLPGGIDHGALADLTADDHTQYALLAGRSGGQTLIGGTASGNSLTLQSTSHATLGNVILDAGKTVKYQLPSTYAGVLVVTSGVGSISLTTAGSGLRLFELPTTPISFDSTSQTLNLFSVLSVFTSAALPRTVLAAQALIMRPTLSPPEVAGAFTLTAMRGVTVQPILTALTTPTGVVTTIAGVLMAAVVVNAGWTVTNVVGCQMADYSGAGVVTNMIGLDVPALTKGATANLSVRSAGDAVELRHAGAGVFGANAAATNASVALEVQSTTKAFLVARMTTVQKNAIAAPIVGMIVYDTTLGAFQGYQGAGVWVAM